MTTIGVQAMMLKAEVEASGAYQTMKAVSAIGYHAVEISQIPMTPTNIADLVRARDDFGLDVAALSTGLNPGPAGSNDALTTDFDKIVSDCRTLGATKVRIGAMPSEALESLETVRGFAAAANEFGRRLADDGIQLCYHNHHFDFTRYDRRFVMDIIAEEAPQVGLEVDVHWVQRGGLDPVTTLARYGERVALVHLKDYRIGRIPASAFVALTAGDNTEFQAEFAKIVQFAEVGEGSIDFRSVIDTSQAIGAEYLFVEQDEQYGRTSLECLRTSYDNMVALGFADLF